MKPTLQMSTALYQECQSIVEDCDYLDENPTLDASFEVEGMLDGELVVADFDGTIKISGYYSEDEGEYSPACCDYNAYVSGVLTWADEDETEHTKDISFHL